MLRYFSEGDLVLDQFVGGGTSLVEAKLLNRDIIGVDVNDVALERCREKNDFEHEGANGKIYLHKDDARNLDFVPETSVDLICTHPPYANIIHYSEDILLPKINGLKHTKLNGVQRFNGVYIMRAA